MYVKQNFISKTNYIQHANRIQIKRSPKLLGTRKPRDLGN